MSNRYIRADYQLIDCEGYQTGRGSLNITGDRSRGLIAPLSKA